MSLSRTSLAAGVALAALVVASQASAAAFYLQEQSVRGAGRAYSGEVADRGAASLWWNPASIAGLDKNEIYGGVHLVQVDSQVDDDGSTLTRPVIPGGLTTSVGGDHIAGGPINNGIVPNLAGAFRINDKLAVGLTVAAPYNFTTDYNGNSWTRYDALKSSLLTVDVNGTVAYRVNDKLDLGVGVSAQYTDAELSSALPNLSPALPDGASSLKGEGNWDYGWNVGAQFHATPALTIGASYRSKIEHELDGKVVVSGLLGPLAGGNISTDGVAKITTPWMANLGARWKVDDKTTLNASISRIGWSEFDQIVVSYPGGGSISEQNYEDTTTAAFGIDYEVNPKLTLRGGVQYDPTPTPNVGRTARVPDGDRTLYAFGSTWQATDAIQWDAAVSYISFKDSKINRIDTFYAGTPAATRLNLQGDVGGSAVVLSTGLRWSF
ncbi:long-chain fatty acid transporter [Caulobacter sp. Root1455]|uniref:outer membrane protein transport protein n=1 Tax=unclassified Caulobacter TaxID=2648921 RepID=UPI0006F5D34A|nr:MULTISPECIES: outer membrane protein transport protein [unclassified Caulobacter]KQY27324.1 long-chain fatty acid transporter [Caulobacter sp. Root487D2Y]KQY92653.1 long-chain fatty acid transporter [Caulobacter sp. Root1455]